MKWLNEIIFMSKRNLHEISFFLCAWLFEFINEWMNEYMNTWNEIGFWIELKKQNKTLSRYSDIVITTNNISILSMVKWNW